MREAKKTLELGLGKDSLPFNNVAALPLSNAIRLCLAGNVFLNKPTRLRLADSRRSLG